MNMIEVKTADLIGPALDWALAKADGADPILWDVCCGNGVSNGNPSEPPECCCNPLVDVSVGGHKWAPSTDWAQGGPLIEKFQIGLLQPSASMCGEWHASTLHPDFTDYTHKTSPLIAACRAIVAANLGDVVSVPAELVGAQANPL